MKKTFICLIIWVIILVLGSGIAGANEVIFLFRNRTTTSYPPYEAYQVFSLFFYLPFFLIPSISATLYFSIKERIKTVKIISLVILIQHILSLIGAIVDMV